MENNFTLKNGINSLNNVDPLNYGALSNEMRTLNKLSTSIDYLGKIKIR